jgi:hypothetical protein
MKCLAVLSFGLVGTLAISAPAAAQESYPAKTPQASSIPFLTPDPLSLEQFAPRSSDKAGTQANKLNDVAKSIRPGGGKSFLRGVGLPTDLIYAPVQPSRDENPLGFFQVDPPTRSVGINFKAN